MLFFSIYDIFLVPVCLAILYFVLRSRASKNKDPWVKNIYYKGFYFKIICTVAFALVSEFIFEGGDTNLYYQGIKDLRAAISDDGSVLPSLLSLDRVHENSSLATYFFYDRYASDVTYNYMLSPANFFVPRLGIFPSMLFLNSYLCISLCFGFFALGGAIRIYKLFYYYYPALKRELAIAILFLPSVGFWSAGLLKDTICFGCVGFILYGAFKIFLKREKYLSSAFWILLCSYIVYTVKAYIFLVLLLAITIWIFAESNRLIKDKTQRRIFGFLMLAVGVGAGFLLLQYFTSQQALQEYQFENLLSSAESQRKNYQLIDMAKQGQSSYYSVNTSNPFLFVVNSIVATFFRPFPWEISSATAALAAIEAMAFLLLTANLFFRKGLSLPFRLIFNDPRSLMSFVFAIVFAIGVGASTANFGALSRYKIPCMPLYLVTIILVYKRSGLSYPKWFQKIIEFIK